MADSETLLDSISLITAALNNLQADPTPDQLLTADDISTIIQTRYGPAHIIHLASLAALILSALSDSPQAARQWWADYAQHLTARHSR